MSNIKLVSVREAADTLGLKPGTLRTWFMRRQFPYVKVGRRTMLKVTDLESFVESNRVDGDLTSAKRLSKLR